MTRFVVDAGAVLHLASEGIEVSAEHELLAPTLLRSQTLSALHEAVQRGEIPADVARDRLARIWRMPIRLLGDAVLRRRAWDLADQLGWASTYNAEYAALTQLQADAFVTLDAELARSVEGIVFDRSLELLGLLSAAWSEVVAGCGASDRSPNQPAPTQRKRGKHVFATGATHLGRRSGSVVRLCLGQAPDPHVIRPPWKQRPSRGMDLPVSLLFGDGSRRRFRRRVPRTAVDLFRQLAR